jgi:hypothetical protein
MVVYGVWRTTGVPKLKETTRISCSAERLDGLDMISDGLEPVQKLVMCPSPPLSKNFSSNNPYACLFRLRSFTLISFVLRGPSGLMTGGGGEEGI